MQFYGQAESIATRLVDQPHLASDHAARPPLHDKHAAGHAGTQFLGVGGGMGQNGGIVYRTQEVHTFSQSISTNTGIHQVMDTISQGGGE